MKSSLFIPVRLHLFTAHSKIAYNSLIDVKINETVTGSEKKIKNFPRIRNN